VRRLQFGKNQAQYEKSYFDHQHDHVILTDTGEVIEFCDPRIQAIKKTIEEDKEYVEKIQQKIELEKHLVKVRYKLQGIYKMQL